MEGERYVGERRALRHFLRELRPLVIAAMGEDALLRFRIDRALASGDLSALRRAREIFHSQPENLKRRLMRGIFAAPDARPAKGQLLQRYTQREPEPFVRFDAYPAADAADLGLSVQLEHELAEDIPVRVLISPGTLPSSAAEALRQIASWIERDRRLLSSRHWQQTASGPSEDAAEDPVDDQDEPQGDSADHA